MEEIGSCSAIIKGISTTVDGAYKLTLEILPEDEKIISRLMTRYGLNKKLLQLGIVGMDDE
jgi:hypothetical protein